jgi:hypothetical protein
VRGVSKTMRDILTIESNKCPETLAIKEKEKAVIKLE